MSETKILKSSWDCPSFTVLVAKKPSLTEYSKII